MTSSSDKIKEIKTDAGQKNGQEKCPKCGATEISLNVKTGKLVCHFCRHEFQTEQVDGFVEDLSTLDGVVKGSGSNDIASDYSDMITLKCTSCGAQVVVDTTTSTQSRCHWCRHVLSINEQIPNGAVPDIILPFKIEKKDVKIDIEKFVKKRSFFANEKFKSEFSLDNIMGVYFPYAVVDINANVKMNGKGEHTTRRYVEGTKEHQRTYYDADLYEITREFDFIIDDLTLETSADKLDKNNKSKTNNIINSIMPFDIENSVKFNSNYMSGFTSEKRDTNLEDLNKLVEVQAKDIARYACGESILYYDRGVRWENEKLDIKGIQWKTAYLPVWVYSYQEKKGNESILHYIVANARTNEIMGSIPINMSKLLLISCLVELLSFFGVCVIDLDYDFLLLSSGFIYYGVMISVYRNSSARHFHERETKNTVNNMKKTDNKIKHMRRLSNSTMHGANDSSVSGIK
ncbi:MAG: TFIIB-type zinc ribbon-containing protein [bacterium]